MTQGERLAEASAMASEWPCQWDREIKSCYVEAFLAGWRARGEADARIADLHMNVPNSEWGDGAEFNAGKIARLIRSLDAPDSGGGGS